MSAFLGPIHFWLYKKINLQNLLAEEILDLNQKNQWSPNLSAEAEERFGNLSKEPLEDIIDQSNIHGWLQQQVVKVEYRLAFIVHEIVKKESGNFEAILNQVETFGKTFAEEGKDATELFVDVQDLLLDGMPCDHVNSEIERSEKKVVWDHDSSNRKHFWDEVGEDLALYYKIRESFIRGFLSKSVYQYKRLEDGLNMIEKES